MEMGQNDGFDLQKWVWYTTNWGMNNSGYDLDMVKLGTPRFLSREFSCSSLAGVFHSEKEKRSPR